MLFRQPKYQLTIFPTEKKDRVLMIKKYARIAELQKDLGNASRHTTHQYLRGKQSGYSGRANRYYPVLRYCTLVHLNKPRPIAVEAM